MRRSILSFRFLIFAGALLIWPSAVNLCAQETRGQILGRVQDQSGAVLPGVTVQAINTATNVKTSSITNENGDYVLAFLIPGTYNLTAELAGFKKFVQEGIIVRVNDKITLNINLQVGELAETVRVVGETPLIESASASIGQVIDNRRISELPLKDGNPIMLSSLSPGVMNLSVGGWSRPFDVNSPSQITVNGVRTFNSEFAMDGAPNTQRDRVAYIPPADVVQEFKIQTATFDASQGYTPGAVINLSLKSGTNELHGTAYHFLQNPALNATKFFTNRAGLPKEVIRLNRWGLSVSGPLWLPKLYNGKNRTFWMYGYEGIHSTDPRGTLTTAVPTEKMKRGDFSDLLKIGPQYQIYDPATIAPAPGGRFSRQPFPGNIIPPNRINPTAQKIMAFWPEPNLPGTIDGSNNWTTPGPEWDHYYTHVFRLDHYIGDRHRIFARGNVNKRIQEYDVRFNNAVGNHFFRFNRGFAIDDVYTFSPRFLMNSRYSYTRFIEGNRPITQGWDLTALGFDPNLPSQIKQVDPRGIRFPFINVAGYGQLSPSTLNFRYDDIHDSAVNFTHMVRSHSLRFGAGFRTYRENGFNLGHASGFFEFGTLWTRGPLDTSPGAPMGQSLASFLLGLPTGGGIDVNGSYAEQSQTWSLYLHDDWKLTSKLTLNVGLRYEVEVPTTERYNRSIRHFDPSVSSPIEAQVKANYALNPIPEVPVDSFRVLGGLTFAGVGGLPRTLWKMDKNNIMPRFGLAYALNPRTVVRGGYGIFYDQLGITHRHVNQSGFSKRTDFVTSLDNGQTFIANLTNPFPSGFDRPAGADLGLMTFVGQAISFLNGDLLTPYMQRWQLGLQREILKQTVIEVSYVGNRGTKLRTQRQLNPIPRQRLSASRARDQATIDFLNAAVPNPFYPLLPKTALAGTTVPRSQLLRPYPHFTSITYENNQGYSWYHSLQTRFEKRFSAGYTLHVSWTWSKFMEATGFLNETDPVPERVISDQDRTHRLVVSALYELPFGRGKRWASAARGLLGKLISDWQVQGIYQGQSGEPLGFGNAIFDGNLKDIRLPKSQRTPERWFNTDAGFERDPRKQLASNIRTLPSRFSGIRADGINNWDLSLIKNTHITESTKIQFRAEFINAFNHTQFSPPNTNPVSTAFGAITSEWQWPRTIQFGLKLIF